jgi:hypothetical protein
MTNNKEPPNFAEGLLEIQRLVPLVQRQPQTKEEAKQYIRELRKGIRVCRKLMKQAAYFPLVITVVSPMKKVLDKAEKTLKQNMKTLNA